MNYPKLSIVTPNFNGAEYLEETIQSVLGQGYANLEYIIIDGGSTDSSVEIIKKYESQLAYWVSEPDKGLYSAIQKGFDKSTGEIMAWINSDDMYHEKSFYVVAEIFNSFKDVNWLQGIPSFIDEMGRITHVASLKRWSKMDYYIGNYKWIQQESTFWRRNLWENAGGKIDTQMKFAGDLDLWLRFFNYDKLYVTPALLGGFRQRSKNQLSLDNSAGYKAEALAKIKESSILNLTVSESNLVEQIRRIDAIIGKASKSPLALIRKKVSERKRNRLVAHYFQYPPVINFDRIKQKFIIL